MAQRVTNRIRSRIVRALGGSTTQLSYSQLGEDRIIQYLAQILQLEKICYVDVGANHPVFGSNTYLFYQLGMRGICVDPDSQLELEHRRTRARDRFLCAAVGTSTAMEATLYKFETSGLNTMDDALAEQYQSFGYPLVGTQRVPMMTLSQVIALAEADVNLLSVDAEGRDLDVLHSLDYSKYRPEIICVETVRYRDDRSEYVETEVEEFLTGQQYIRYADTHVNRIYVLNEKYCQARKI